MKYTSLDPVKEKSLHIGPFEKGLDLSRNPLYIDKKALSECKNVICEGSVLKTRSGLNTAAEHIIKSDYTTESFFNTYKINDNDFFINNNSYRIITETAEMGFSQYCISFFLLNQNRELTSIGTMSFKRSSDAAFYIPSNITFFQAKPQSGCGIYAFFTLSNLEGLGENIYEIYELNEDLDNWKKIEDYYIPTVYINGRGNMYKAAEAADNLTLDPPKLLEAPNMLNGIFYAYYSSDGYSSSFTLPFSNISNATVNCRIHYSLEAYADWTVYAGETTATKEFMGAKVTMNVDRLKGIIYFTVEAGDYSVPYMSKYRINNIKITASKKDPSDFSDIVSCTCCKVSNSRIILSGGDKSDCIYSANYDNPLYFPQTAFAQIGEDRLPVKALSLQKDKIIAFKPNGIYRLELKKGKRVNSISLLADNDSVFYETDSFSVVCIDNTVGCNAQSATVSFHEKTLFAGTDGNFYSISDSFNIKPLSGKIKEYLKEFEREELSETVVLSDEKYCYFFLNNIAYIAVPDDGLNADKTLWYIWQFPEEVKIKGGKTDGNSLILLCTNSYTTCYTAVLDGNEDIVPDITNSAEPIQNFKIESRITTANFAPEGINRRIKLTRIYLYMSAKGKTEICLNGKAVNFSDNPTTDSANSLTRVIIFPEIYCTNSIYITVWADEQLVLSEGEICYV